MIEAYCDGACRVSNPGITSCAWVVYEGEREVKHQAYFLGPELHTNNYAEFQGLIKLLEHLHSAHIKDVVIYCDSALVVNTVNGIWTPNKPDISKMCAYATGLMTVGYHRLIHIKGHDGIAGNEEADRLCNEELDRQEEHVKTMGSNNKQTQS
jgi:ribonuclease HI